MQKKLLASLITLSLTSFAAHADITWYGFLSAGVESVKANGNGDTKKNVPSTQRVTDQSSRLGVKGSTKVEDDVTVYGQIETSLRSFDQGGVSDKGETATLATRNTFVGIGGDFGKFELGQKDSAYKILTDIGLDAMSNTTASNTGSSGTFSRGEARLKNSIHYLSPNLSGVELGMSYGFDEARTLATDGSRQKNDRLSLAGKYKTGALQLAAAYDRQGSKNDSGNTVKELNSTVFTKLVASYTLPSGTFIGGGIEQAKMDYATGKDPKQTFTTLTLGQTFGKTTLRASYTTMGALKNTRTGNEGDYKAKQWVLGATYDIYKQTQLYAYATKIKNEKSQNANLGNAVYDTGLGTSSASLTKGNDPQAFGAGIRYTF